MGARVHDRSQPDPPWWAGVRVPSPGASGRPADRAGDRSRRLREEEHGVPRACDARRRRGERPCARCNYDLDHPAMSAKSIQTLPFEACAVGDKLPPLERAIDLTTLVRYAGASGDYNPIHHDEAYARAAGLDGVMGHGMLAMGLASEA